MANLLRTQFPGIYPDADGKRHESTAMGAGGLKKLDVNFMTPQMGLALAVSFKTINFKDEKTQRYTKNVKRVDGELRAEAQDVHRRQPYAVLVGIILLPVGSTVDGVNSCSSFKHAWDVFERRSGRKGTDDENSHFELIFMGVYDTSPEGHGKLELIDVATMPPDQGWVSDPLTFSQVVEKVVSAFRTRNRI